MMRREWDLKRNCAIAPRQLAGFYVSMCFTSFLVAAVWTVRGAWFVLVFATFEMLAVGFAFLAYARHATDREHITLQDDWLVVELIEAEEVRQYRLALRSIRILGKSSRRELICLEADGVRVEVGRFLTEWRRREFVQELRQVLQISCK
ncbi:DUF2244 domain-containing protein [Glaciimonas sp. PAMC28666]|uniref:DUF2244 domain-containing protein n=1 Tax=Glaciimonas sp. PAMC28666 TaxID=2807626 RepID=UPI0019639F8F|nr:DUF2244 domain-containing protein [Glaciimonas sp. PAMC28666]QRX83776.1 DUF2244 domain-containing protein [Glaciimonas sp. PAMC28666]